MDESQPEGPVLPPLVSQFDRRIGTLQRLMYGICLDADDHQQMWKKLRERREHHKDSYGGDNRAWLKWLAPVEVIATAKDVYKLGGSGYPKDGGTEVVITYLWATGSNRNKPCALKAYDPERIQSLKELLDIDDPNCKLRWFWTSDSVQATATKPYPSPWTPGGLLFIDCGWEEAEQEVICLYTEVRVRPPDPIFLPLVAFEDSYPSVQPMCLHSLTFSYTR